MKKIFLIISFILIGVFIYISCSEDTETSTDTQITSDTEIRDIVDNKDVVTDTEKDIGITDTEIKDQQVEDIKDIQETDILVIDDGVPDAGTETEDVITDTNPPPLAKIIAGAGIDIIYNSQIRQIRIDNNYGSIKDIQMTVPDSRVPYYLRMDELHFDLLFGDTDGSKSLSDNDKLLRIITSKDFYGETEGMTRLGDDISKAKGEFGNSDYSTITNIEGTDYNFDFYFKKGINIASDTNKKITGFTIYRPQKVVPSDDIDYENSRVLGITADIAILMSSATKISDMRKILGPEDLMVEDNTNKLIYYNYLSIGFTAIDSQSSSGDVKTITLFPPYFGKLKGTNLSIGSTKGDIDSFFSKKYGPAKTLQQGDATIYYYVVKVKDLGIKKYNICLGFIYNQTDNATAILVGLPVEQK